MYLWTRVNLSVIDLLGSLKIRDNVLSRANENGRVAVENTASDKVEKLCEENK